MTTKDHLLYYEERNYPTAFLVERTVNSGMSLKEILQQLKETLQEDHLRKFMLGCLLWWAETERYDERNRFAVLASKVIVEKFPQLKEKALPDDVMQESHAFTSYAHRYLQNEFFKAIFADTKANDEMGIVQWFESQEFVYDDNAEKLVPYQEYKINRY